MTEGRIAEVKRRRMRWRRLDEQVVKIVKLKEKSFQEKQTKQTERRNNTFNRERQEETKEIRAKKDRSKDKTNGGQKERGSRMT